MQSNKACSAAGATTPVVLAKSETPTLKGVVFGKLMEGCKLRRRKPDSEDQIGLDEENQTFGHYIDDAVEKAIDQTAM